MEKLLIGCSGALLQKYVLGNFDRSTFIRLIDFGQNSIDRVLQNFRIFQAIPHEFYHSSLIDLQNIKTQKLTKASENNKAKGLTNVNQGVQIHNIWHSSHFSKQSQPTCFHYGVFGHIRPHCPQVWHQLPWIRKTEQKTGNSSSKPSKPHHAFLQQRHYPQRGSPSCRQCGKYGHTKAECFRTKNQTNEWLVNMMKSVLIRLINLDMAHTPASQIENVWVRKDETIHPLRGSGLT